MKNYIKPEVKITSYEACSEIMALNTSTVTQENTAIPVVKYTNINF